MWPFTGKGVGKGKAALVTQTVLLDQGNQTTKLSAWFLLLVRTDSSHAPCSSIANRTPGTSERKMLAFHKGWMFLSTVIFFFDGLLQLLPLRKQLILIKHSPGMISMCYWSGINSWACTSVLVLKNSFPNQRRQGWGSREVMNTSANPTGWARAQQNPKAHAQLQACSAEDLVFPERLKQGGRAEKKGVFDSTLMVRNINRWSDGS